MLQLVVAVLNAFVAGSGTHAQHFVKFGRHYDLDPLLVAAVAFKESEFKRFKISRTNDYGLMQLHVGKNTHARYVGREGLLFETDRNIRLGARMMAWWKSHHARYCKEDHHWLLHYNQGARVRKKGWRGQYAQRVLKIYHRLLEIRADILRHRHATS